MQLLRKISVRTVFGDKGNVQEAVMSDKTKAHRIMRIVGVANGVKSGSSRQKVETTEGQKEVERSWKALLGNFEATNTVTGEVFRSGVCFLPDFAIEAVAGQLTEDVDNVAFGFDLTASYDETAATSYVYDVTPLMEVSENDPLAQLSAKLAQTKALPLPDKAAKK